VDGQAWVVGTSKAEGRTIAIDGQGIAADGVRSVVATRGRQHPHADDDSDRQGQGDSQRYANKTGTTRRSHNVL